MTTEQFQATLHQNPFQPFTIRMADGRAFEVRHRDLVSRSPSGRTVIVHHDNENYSVLDMLLLIAAQRMIHRTIVTSRAAGLPLVGLAYSPRSRL